MKILGAVIAGGQSKRFGTDKAVALVDGLPLIDHIVMGLYRHTDFLVISGRDWRDFETVDDGIYAGQGPLAGLYAALCYAKNNGFDAVLSAACDTLPVPDLSRIIGNHPAVVEGHWLFGFWPIALTEILDLHLADQTDRSLRGWIRRCGAQLIAPEIALYNLNSKDDIMRYEGTIGRHG
jgi:molybdenum cofactor guanylyltransferase